MQATKTRKLNTQNQIWLLVTLLVILVAVSVALAGTCLYSYAHQSDNEISLYNGSANKQSRSKTTTYQGTQAKRQVQKTALKVNDAKKVWSTETPVELFKVRYRNGKGEVTAESSGKDKIIAPGTDGKYSFALKNTGNKAMKYKVQIEAEVTGGKDQIAGVPLEARMSDGDNWLLGDDAQWKDFQKLDGISTSKSLAAGKQTEYTMYWKWQFERGKDEEDTALGNAEKKDDLTYTVKIRTLAVEDLTSGKNGENEPGTDDSSTGKRSILNRIKTGDTADLALWAGIFAVAAGMILVLIIWKKKRKVQEE